MAENIPYYVLHTFPQLSGFRENWVIRISSYRMMIERQDNREIIEATLTCSLETPAPKNKNEKGSA